VSPGDEGPVGRRGPDLVPAEPTPGERFDRARRRKLQRAESHVALVRDLVAAFVWLTVPFLWGRFPPWPFGTVLAAATAHTALAHLAHVRDWGSLPRRALATSVGDAVAILAFLAVTGGAGSPLTPLLYVSMAAVAYRYELRDSLAFGTAYGVGYLVTLTLVGDPIATVDIVLRVGLLVLTGMLSALSSTSYLEAEIRRSRTERAFEDVLGTVPGDVAVVHVEDLGREPTDRGAGLAASLPGWMDEAALARSRRALDSVFDEAATVEYEVTAGRRPDERATYRCVAGPLGDGVETAVIVATDVTERRLAERRLRDHARALEQSNEALARYASVTAHDLREPLRDIVRYLQRLERREHELSEDSREDLAFVVQRARRLDALVRALHRFAEVDERRLRTRPVDLAEALSDALEAIDVDDPPELRVHTGQLDEITADPLAIRAILEHLLVNAHQHAGRDPVNVWVDSEPTDDGWRVVVEDDGQGIDPRFHEQIFEPFRPRSPAPEGQQARMGLARVRRLVERLGGEIDVDSEPGAGARFTVTVPGRSVLAGPRRQETEFEIR